MIKKDRQSRKYSRKALDRVNEVKNKFPSGIPDVSAISEEARAWLEKKIQQTRECLKNVKFPLKPVWWETFRLTRNKTAHQTDDFSDEEFSNLCEKLFSNLDRIGSDLQDNIKRYKQKSKKKRQFENVSSPAFGSESDRKQLVDAIEDAIFPVEPEDLKINFPENDYSKVAERTLSEILNHGEIKDYAILHEGLSENIQTDLIEWLEKTQKTLEKENPFFDEIVFIEQQKKLSAKEIATELSAENSKIQYHYKRLPSVSDSKRGNIAPSLLDFDFYKKAFSEQKKIKKNKDGNESTVWKSDEQLEILRRNFFSDMERNLIERKNKWKQERIDELRKKFLEELYKKIENFMRLEKLLSPFVKGFGRLWDLSEGMFNTSGFEILNQFAELLEKDESLQELVELLGKQRRAQSSFEKEMRDKTVIKTEWSPKTAYRGEINGLCYSADIASVVPSELSMMKNPAAQKLFQLKFAQKQLLSFQYQNMNASLKEEIEQEEITIEKKEPKGPIIICVDTSGSMNCEFLVRNSGSERSERRTPENIAKTVTFALSKIAIEEERKCYLISFSKGIETMDLSDFSGGKALEKLVQFLRMSFNGGTDASRALLHAVEMLKKDSYKNADVLMISDFVMGSFGDELEKKIEEEKKNKTDFYSLVIGTSGNEQTIKCFNHNWLYDTSDPNAQRHLVEQLNEIK